MNDKEERELIIGAKKTFVNWIVTFFCASAIGLTAFYFNTNYVIAQNSSGIKEIKEDVKKVTTVPVLNQNKIKNIEKDVARIEKAQKENHNETRETQKEMRKEMQKILEVLYQIRQQNN